ncbi:unnamed protein product [Bubo scandiacus]
MGPACPRENQRLVCRALPAGAVGDNTFLLCRSTVTAGASEPFADELNASQTCECERHRDWILEQSDRASLTFSGGS